MRSETARACFSLPGARHLFHIPSALLFFSLVAKAPSVGRVGASIACVVERGVWLVGWIYRRTYVVYFTSLLVLHFPNANLFSASRCWGPTCESILHTMHGRRSVVVTMSRSVRVTAHEYLQRSTSSKDSTGWGLRSESEQRKRVSLYGRPDQTQEHL